MMSCTTSAAWSHLRRQQRGVVMSYLKVHLGPLVSFGV
jgi:hypothetical protein